MNESTQQTVANYRGLLDGTDRIMSRWIAAAEANPEPADPAQVTSIVLSIRRAVDIRRILAAWENTPDPNEDDDGVDEDFLEFQRLSGEMALQDALKRHGNDWGKVAKECNFWDYIEPEDQPVDWAAIRNAARGGNPPPLGDSSFDLDPDNFDSSLNPNSDGFDSSSDPDSDDVSDSSVDSDLYNASDYSLAPGAPGIPPIPPVPPVPPPRVPDSLAFKLPATISAAAANAITPDSTVPAISTSPDTLVSTTPTPSTTSTSSTPSTESTPSTLSPEPHTPEDPPPTSQDRPPPPNS